jgi:hypothetical protein
MVEQGVGVLVQLVAEDNIVETRMVAMGMVLGLALCRSLALFHSLVLYHYIVLCH